MTIAFSVNGVAHEVEAARGADRLIDFLHEDLNLTGTKFCCGVGVCRACTVSVTRPPNWAATPIISCSIPLSMVDGAEIVTIEGVSAPGALSPIQQEFLTEFAFQCGYCTPGFVIAAKIFLDGLRVAPIPHDRLDQAIETAIGSHICRCSGYVRYYQAIRKLAEAMLDKGI
jgi:aerobic-type carbon monoxide dehydrogenase small subunit (CoxS/CutS family)